MFEYNDLVKEINSLKKFAWHLAGNKSDAEDLLQNTLLKALEKNYQFQQDSNLFSWTSKIMFHQFINEYRRRLKFDSKYDPDPYINRMYVAPSQEKKAEFFEVDEALSTLTQKHREVLFMICIAGMGYKAVAKNLKIPVGTVRSRLSRAREQLQNHMDKPLLYRRAG
ncbi:MAG: hypothetical protein CO093_08735 [Alphaproteobacteria bacterium CG_4_9_14_3_um_filter_47_13]|nr:MAG: hypothetical protein CO093_08735 [Alphaproteobacteria bacterium CG_4_9_14_3_um_filter_47_13]